MIVLEIILNHKAVMSTTVVRLLHFLYLSMLIIFDFLASYLDCNISEACSVTCGGGKHQCERTCINGNVGDVGCELENQFKIEDCNIQECRT